MSEIDYEEEVKKLFPKAFCEHVDMYDCYVIRQTNERYLNPRINDLDDRTKLYAWQSGYNILKEQNKL